MERGANHRADSANVSALAESLSRTLLLIRDEVGLDIDDSVLLTALTSTRVALVADAANIASHSAQSAFVTAAMLMARSGHKVFLVAPNVEMLAPQPPLRSGAMIDELARVGTDMLPGVAFVVGEPQGEVDLAIALGDAPFTIPAHRRVRLNAGAWSGEILTEDHGRRWEGARWPLGAMAAAALGAGEAFKVAMRKLLPHALNVENTALVFADTERSRFELAPPDTPCCPNFGEIDCISGGAITNAALYCLARIPGVTARGRIIEPDVADLTNLNRYMLLLRSRLGSKAHDLAQYFSGEVHFEPLAERYEPTLLESIAPLAPLVLVGVDHIPTRWAVQQAMPDWLVVGATTHWSAMASYHAQGLACARCLHNEDDPGDGPIPTTACVSFWAGLLTVAYLARHAAGEVIPNDWQQVYLTPFRPENAFPAAVAVRPDCPTCQATTADR